MKTIIYRLIYFPFSLFKSLFVISNDYCRDFENKMRFKRAKIDTGSCLSGNSVIGIHSHILSHCVINNSQIGNYSYIGRNSLIQNTQIGNYCSIANDVMIGLGKHPLDLFSTSPVFYKRNNTIGISVVQKESDFKEYEKINIGNDVWIGARAIIMDGVIIGDGAVVAAGSVVTKDIEPYMIVAGVPAKPVRKRNTDKRIKHYRQAEWWNLSPSEAYKIFE